MLMTRANLRVMQADLITLRIRFSDGNMVNIAHGAMVRVTTSSPALLADCKVNGRLSIALKALRSIDKRGLPNETLHEKMQRFQRLAMESPTITDFAENLGVLDGVEMR